MVSPKVVQPDLFLTSSGIAWLPGETVFSLASRYHLLTRHVHAQRTALELFGDTRSGFPHDLPSGISHFARVNAASLGTADSIIWNHTILPFFLPFRNTRDTVEAITLMCAPHIGDLKSKLGILASRFGAAHPLKACRICMDHDHQSFGVAYWHRDHQLPGIWLCPQHGLPLEYSTCMSSGEARFRWLLPAADDLQKGIDLRSSTKVRNPEASVWRLIQSIREVARLPFGCNFEPSRLLATYRVGLQQNHLLSPRGRMRMDAVGQSYFDALQVLRMVPELTLVAPTLALATAQASRLLREPRSGTHTLRHLTMIIWLFGTWDAFCQTYRSIKPGKIDKVDSGKNSRDYASEMNDHSRRTRLVALLQQSRTSLSHAASIVGVQTSTAQAWAADAGIVSPRRPKLLNLPLRKKLISRLTDGQEKIDVARQCGVSASSVSRVLRTEIGLHHHWEIARNQRRAKEARTKWRNALTSTHYSGIEVARKLQPSAYAWLYRNDRAWLQNQNERIKPSTRGNNSHVDWDKRDRELARQIQTAASDLIAGAQHFQPTVIAICGRVKGLKSKLRRLEKLPLTTRTLRNISSKSH